MLLFLYIQMCSEFEYQHDIKHTNKHILTDKTWLGPKSATSCALAIRKYYSLVSTRRVRSVKHLASSLSCALTPLFSQTTH